ncbi:AlpA family transcriptional regulator [Actinomadura sp. WMMA1423]|uniref:helix-turn-helix transcriptional regulator n=1 Tax=Actinomadura sp. WMMA1423 TaxID=2591108 RepID=UPI0011472752|nr:DNA-binding protein [Actinomadura sp. WMMA1423]
MHVTNGSRPAHARAEDRLLPFEEIVERLPMPEASIRWKRHKGEMDFIFRLGRRLVAWESDLLNWVEEQAAKDRAATR